MKYSLFKKQENRGVAALIVVVVVGAAALLMAMSAARLGLGELEMGYIAQKGDETLYLADGCVEDTLERLRVNPAYTGGTITLGGGSCVVSVGISGSNRTIIAGATVGDFNKKVQAEATIVGGVVTLTSWNEMSL